ncbi:hypothetical protein GEMRC1_002186 [Eukaryota sp. GEM-RC1]
MCHHSAFAFWEYSNVSAYKHLNLPFSVDNDPDKIFETISKLNTACTTFADNLSQFVQDTCQMLLRGSSDTRRKFVLLNGHTILVEFISFCAQFVRKQLKDFQVDFSCFDSAEHTNDPFERFTILSKTPPITQHISLPRNVNSSCISSAVGILKSLSVDCQSIENPDYDDEADNIESLLLSTPIFKCSFIEDLVVLALSTSLFNPTFFDKTNATEYIIVLSTAAAEGLNLSSNDLIRNPSLLHPEKALPLPGSRLALGCLTPVHFCIFSRVLGPLSALPAPNLVDSTTGYIKLVDNGLTPLSSPFLSSPATSSYIHSVLTSCPFLACRLALLISLQSLVAPFTSKLIEHPIIGFYVQFAGLPNASEIVNSIRSNYPNKSKARREVINALSAIFILQNPDLGTKMWMDFTTSLLIKRGAQLHADDVSRLRDARLCNLATSDRQPAGAGEILIISSRAEILLITASLANGVFRSYFLKSLFTPSLPSVLSLRHSLGLVAQRRWDPSKSDKSRINHARCFDHRHDILIATSARLLFAIASSASKGSLSGLCGSPSGDISPESAFGVLQRIAVKLVKGEYRQVGVLPPEDDEHNPEEEVSVSTLGINERMIGFSRIIPFFDSFLHPDSPACTANFTEGNEHLGLRVKMIRESELIECCIMNLCSVIETGSNRLESLLDFLGTCVKFPSLRKEINSCLRPSFVEELRKHLVLHTSESSLFIRNLVFEYELQHEGHPFNGELLELVQFIVNNRQIFRNLFVNITISNVQRGNMCVLNTGLVFLHFHPSLFNEIELTQMEQLALKKMLILWRQTYLISQSELTSFNVGYSLVLRRSLSKIVRDLITKLSA